MVLDNDNGGKVRYVLLRETVTKDTDNRLMTGLTDTLN